MGVTTSNLLGDPAPSLDEMLQAFDEAMSVPQPIGSLMGVVIYLHHDTRELSIGDVKCSVDHPYLAGTPIHAGALRALGEAV